MRQFIIQRLLLMIPTLIGVSLMVFMTIAFIPGDPATAILGAYATPENVLELNKQLGLDQPLITQYLNWITHIFQGDFGYSYSLERPVIDEILERFSATLILASSAFTLCCVFGLWAGISAAINQFKLKDRLLTTSVLIGISTPSFWLGLICIYFFSVKWQILPASGMYSFYGGGDIWDLLKHLIMPAITLSVVAIGVIARLTRTAMLEVLRQDFIRTARAKGCTEHVITYRHALKMAMVNIIPILGIQAGFVIGGAVYIETVFQWPGIGRMLVQAISARDILLVQGGIFAHCLDIHADQFSH